MLSREAGLPHIRPTVQVKRIVIDGEVGYQAHNPLAWDMAKLVGSPVLGVIPEDRLQVIAKHFDVEIRR